MANLGFDVQWGGRGHQDASPFGSFFGQFVNFVIANNVYVGYDFMDGGVMVGVLYNISDVAYV
jgi:uncharacterized protein YggL (DUF469 family)